MMWIEMSVRHGKMNPKAIDSPIVWVSFSFDIV